MSNEFAAFINVIGITLLELASSKHAEDRIDPNISTVFENLTKNRSQKINHARWTLLTED